jgi:L-lactate dehydrogenase complex protein LldG
VISSLAGKVLARPRLYRGLEPALRLFQSWGSRRFPGLTLAPESFHRARKAVAAGSLSEPPSWAGLTDPDFSGQATEADGNSGAEAPVATPTRSLEASLAEADAVFHRIRGPEELARRLASLGEPIWLQDHPWLRRVASALADQGLKPRLASTAWGPSGETAVIIGLGAIPETGSVLIEAAAGPAAALSFQVRRLVVIVPEGKAGLSMAQALKLTARQAPMITWLTGPSRTADIEKILVLGAHGPQELHVVLYQSEA